jgi:hypothetical protein
MVHEEGWTLERRDGRFIATPPDAGSILGLKRRDVPRRR